MTWSGLLSLKAIKDAQTGAPVWLSQLSVQLLVSTQLKNSWLHGLKPPIGLCIDSVEPAWNSLSTSLCPSPTCAVSVSLLKKKALKMHKFCLSHRLWSMLHMDHLLYFSHSLSPDR